MDQIFYVNSASFVDISITSSLIAALGSNIDFSQATQVSGSFVGTLQGNASTATSASHAVQADNVTSASHAIISDTTVSASYATQASNAISSSYTLIATTASYVVGQRIKAGIVSGSQFSGNPQTYNVIFTSGFPNTLYTVTITGDSARSWLAQNLSTSGFTISANTKTTTTGFVYWQAIAVGEFNS